MKKITISEKWNRIREKFSFPAAVFLKNDSLPQCADKRCRKPAIELIRCGVLNRALRQGPYRLGKMWVVLEPGDDVPMNMRGNIAKACKVHLLWPQTFAQYRLKGKHNVHQVRTLGSGQIGHFPDMGIPDYATEARIAMLLDAHDSAGSVLP